VDGASEAGAAGDAVTDAGAFATGLASAGGGTAVADGAAMGRGGTAAGAPCFWIKALRTSPGREMFERSILVLIPSLSEREAELEWVFFSVIPANTRASRIALLLTSISLARSLIRILLIRLYIPPVSLGLHRDLTGFRNSILITYTTTP
jgi:hypothetical protein